MARITIVGAGIIGMAIATELSRYHEVTIIARNLPGDEDSIEWASPWAGALFIAGGCSSARDKKLQLDTFSKLWRWSSRFPESSLKRTRLDDIVDDDREIWWKDDMPEFRFLDKKELPEGARSGNTYTTVVLNPQIFLPWLRGKLENSGVEFKRMSLNALKEADHLGHDVLINATGSGPQDLEDIRDMDMKLLRGQTMLVKTDYTKIFMRDDGENYTYVIPRLDGTAILGGIRHQDVTNTEVDPKITKDILRRINGNLPEHFPADPSNYEIIRHNVGIRPGRTSGIRIQKEVRDGGKIIHAYGTGGAGFIYSFGIAQEVIRLVDEFWSPTRETKL